MFRQQMCEMVRIELLIGVKAEDAGQFGLFVQFQAVFVDGAVKMDGQIGQAQHGAFKVDQAVDQRAVRLLVN